MKKFLAYINVFFSIALLTTLLVISFLLNFRKDIGEKIFGSVDFLTHKEFFYLSPAIILVSVYLGIILRKLFYKEGD
ncbi:hypothetical protein DES40_1196 [Litorimonas taeanensis]|uniref:Uncharacterized protein n=1 Tax=Litorimonas taeanensis TaxID=568099 RepID=A0A420WLG8_9PROT|nr:hypothetical protein DES40_1196 [Litorimonas taeanensis]